MSMKWINDRIDELPPGVIQAKERDDLFGVVSRTEFGDAGDVLDPTFVAKVYKDIGRKSF